MTRNIYVTASVWTGKKLFEISHFITAFALAITPASQLQASENSLKSEIKENELSEISNAKNQFGDEAAPSESTIARKNDHSSLNLELHTLQDLRDLKTFDLSKQPETGISSFLITEVHGWFYSMSRFQVKNKGLRKLYERTRELTDSEEAFLLDAGIDSPPQRRNIDSLSEVQLNLHQSNEYAAEQRISKISLFSELFGGIDFNISPFSKRPPPKKKQKPVRYTIESDYYEFHKSKNKQAALDPDSDVVTSAPKASPRYRVVPVFEKTEVETLSMGMEAAPTHHKNNLAQIFAQKIKERISFRGKILPEQSEEGLKLRYRLTQVDGFYTYEKSQDEEFARHRFYLPFSEGMHVHKEHKENEIDKYSFGISDKYFTGASWAYGRDFIKKTSTYSVSKRTKSLAMHTLSSEYQETSRQNHLKYSYSRRF